MQRTAVPVHSGCQRLATSWQVPCGRDVLTKSAFSIRRPMRTQPLGCLVRDACNVRIPSADTSSTFVNVLQLSVAGGLHLADRLSHADAWMLPQVPKSNEC